MAKTLHWVTDQTIQKEQIERELLLVQQEEQRKLSANEVQRYKKKLERKSRNEHDKIWRSLVAFATLNFNGDSNQNKDTNVDETKTVRETAVTSSLPETESFEFADPNDLLVEERSSQSNSNDVPGVPREQLLVFMKRARAAYGRTALCLSGGAMVCTEVLDGYCCLVYLMDKSFIDCFSFFLCV